MAVSERKNLFIVIEGIDNCGKTTQSSLLKEYLESKRLKVVTTREPGGTEVGEEIRGILLKNRDELLDPKTQTLLFYTSRQEYLSKIVRPNLDQGMIVITDRFDSSTYVYQGYTQGMDKSFIDLLHQSVVVKSGCEPDIYIIIDITPEESFKRLQNEDNKGQKLVYESQGLEFMGKVRQGYLEFTKGKLNRQVVPLGKKLSKGKSLVALINGMRDKEEIHQEIVGIIDKLLG